MNNENPLINITESGTYRLRLVRPNTPEKWAKRFKMNARNFATCRLFFMAENNYCLTKNYSAEYGKGLTILVGKMTNTFANDIAPTITLEQLKKFVEPAFGCIADIEIDVQPDSEWNGKPQYKYLFKSIKSVVSKPFNYQAGSNNPGDNSDPADPAAGSAIDF